MLKTTDRPATSRKSTQAAVEITAAITSFIQLAKTPAILEAGDEPQLLRTGEFAVLERNGTVVLEVWSGVRSFVRRVISVDAHKSGLLDCTIERFGGKTARLTVLDLAKAQTLKRTLQGTRQNFTERFRRMLTRQFPGWDVPVLSTETDLSRSFSPVFPRAIVQRGLNKIAVLACPKPEQEHAFLTFALIWHSHVFSRSKPGEHVTLALFLPETGGNTTALRLRWLTKRALGTRVFRFNLHGSAGEIDLADLGNLDTRLLAPIPDAGAMTDLGDLLDKVHDPSLALSDRMPRRHPVLRSHSEDWLELAVRKNIAEIDASLNPQPIHGQMITFAATDRDLIDLVAIRKNGQVTVLELKASEDLHLPLQALDYWMRIAWHAEAGDLARHFPATAVRPIAPRLLLVAPALCFHPTCATILSYFSSAIDVERVGLNLEWREQLKVALRLSGADSPISHRNSS